jgi:hypothetical protein
LQARDSDVFGNLKCLFSTTPEVGKETKANGGHRGDRMLHQTWSWYDRTRSVSSAQQLGARVLGFATGASGHSWDRHVRSCAQWELQNARMIRRVARPATHDRTRPIVEGAYWTQTGRGHCRVRSLRGAHPVMSLRAQVLCDRRVRSLRGARPVIASRARVSVRSARPIV